MVSRGWWQATKWSSSISRISGLAGPPDWSLVPGQGMTWLEAIDEAPWFVEHVIGTEGEKHGNGLGDINMDGRLDVYACAYANDPATRSLTWAPVAGVGNGVVSGSWSVEPTGAFRGPLQRSCSQ